MNIIKCITDCLYAVVSDTPPWNTPEGNSLLEDHFFNSDPKGFYVAHIIVYKQYLSKEEKKTRDAFINSFDQLSVIGDEDAVRNAQIDKFKSLSNEDKELLFPGIGKSFHTCVGCSPIPLD